MILCYRCGRPAYAKVEVYTRPLHEGDPSVEYSCASHVSDAVRRAHAAYVISPVNQENDR